MRVPRELQNSFGYKMEEQVDRLVEKTWDKFQRTPKSKRLMIAVSGIPGSGALSTITSQDASSC